jgi:class 3 adenylate cyclase/tetratricopeptide (TPR) repeat protein
VIGEQVSMSQTRRVVTVLFADVADSTPLTVALDPEAVRGVLAQFYGAARAAVERHGGVIEKYIGDAAMAVFGLRELHEDDALRAARAATELRATAAALDEELRRRHDVGLAIRVGIATGEVVAGDAIGTLVTGAPVNLAARLQAAAAPGEILVDEATRVRAGDAAVADQARSMELKGFPAPVLVHRLVDADATADAIPRRLDSPLIGRTGELARLQGTFERVVADREPHVATVVGGAGVGKSRLVHELVGRARHAGARVLRGRCLPYGESITYWPIAELIHAAAGIDVAEARDTARERLAALTDGIEHAPLVADRVATLLGLADATAPAEETTWAVRRLFEELARTAPLVLVVDDIQWAEAALLDLLEQLVDLAADSRLLLVAMARPEIADARPTWLARSGRSTVIRLDPLPGDDAGDLLATLTEGAALPPGIRSRILDAADGNPLFIEQYVGMLIDGGHLRRSDDATTDGELVDVPVPPTVQALIAARLDRLGERERPTLLRASVVGRTFWRGALTDLSPAAERPAVGPAIAALAGRQLVLPDASTFPGDEAFRFRHLLVRDAAYESLPKAARADLHEAFAGWLERRAGDRLGEFHEILAHHLEGAATCVRQSGGDRARALRLSADAGGHLLAAAERAFRRGDMPAVVALVERARAQLPAGDRRVVIQLPWLGKAAMETGDLDGAVAILDEAFALAREAGVPDAASEARSHRLMIDLWRDPVGAADRVATEARALLAAAEARGDERGQALAWALLAEPLWMQARNLEAIGMTREVIRHARLAGDERMALEHIAINASGSVGPFVVVHAACRSAIVEGGGSPMVEARARPLLGLALARAGRVDAGRADVDAGIALCRSLGLRLWEAEMREVAAQVEWLAGDLARSTELGEVAFGALEGAGMRTSSVATASVLALVSAASGDVARAREWLQHVAAVAPELNRAAGEARVAQALVAWRDGDVATAELVLRTSVATSDEYSRLEAVRVLGALLLLSGRPEEAAAILDPAEEQARSDGWLGLAERIAAARREPARVLGVA